MRKHLKDLLCTDKETDNDDGVKHPESLGLLTSSIVRKLGDSECYTPTETLGSACKTGIDLVYT
jgi:hypothetical protein